MRDDLEKKGFTVRSWVPESTKSKFPSRGLIFKTEKSRSSRCRETLQHEIGKWEIENDIPAQYALLGDAGTVDKRDKRKRVLVAILAESEFRRHFEQNHEVFTFNGCSYEIFGAYHEGRVRWNCDDEKFVSYFFEGGDKVTCHFYDAKTAFEAEREEARKRQKKEAKK